MVTDLVRINSNNQNNMVFMAFLFSLSQEKFDVFVNASAEVSKEKASILDLWKKVKTRLYSLDDRHKELGLGEKVRLQYTRNLQISG